MMAVACLGLPGRRCFNVTPTGPRCRDCAREWDRERRRSYRQRGYDYAYEQRRRAAITAEPWCHNRACPRADAGTPANPLSADHVIPVVEGGQLGPITVLCKRCNSAKRDRRV